MAAPSKAIGLIGLGSMGKNIAKRLHKEGYSLVLYNRTQSAYSELKDLSNAYFSKDINDFVKKIKAIQETLIIWVMVPGGAPTDSVILELSGTLQKNDIVIDASNSIYQDSISNYNKLKAKGIFYLDVGCAGGPEDLQKGVALMVGGDMAAFKKAEPVFQAVCGDGAYGYLGKSGSGHMTKLVHNGIFYGIFPVYAEGIELLLKLKDEDPSGGFDLKEALKLLEACPPINRGIMSSISSAISEDRLPERAPEVKVSEMVKWEVAKAEQSSVSLSITKSIFTGYSTMSEKSRKIYYGAKKILTGH